MIPTSFCQNRISWKSSYRGDFTVAQSPENNTSYLDILASGGAVTLIGGFETDRFDSSSVPFYTLKSRKAPLVLSEHWRKRLLRMPVASRLWQPASVGEVIFTYTHKLFGVGWVFSTHAHTPK
jgi:hypothetical protein